MSRSKGSTAWWSALVPASSPPMAVFKTPIAGEGCILRVEASPLPMLRTFGMAQDPSTLALQLEAQDGAPHVPQATSSFMLEGDGGFRGFRADFLLPTGTRPRALLIDEEHVMGFPEDLVVGRVEPHYANLYDTEEMLGRQHIYGYGPPSDVSQEFKQLMQVVEGDVLDFGCGNGDLLTWMRGRGANARGLELARPEIDAHLHPDAAAHVTRYGGDVPLPFADAEFDWLVSTEVIEHVPDPARFIPEFARILRPGGRMMVTVPDISAIPSGFLLGMIPWHLLESTHINFFNINSLRALFAGHFRLARSYALSTRTISGVHIPGSIGAEFVRLD